MEIIETFERHGFIWGGKWYHYDTMHFEFRPEIIAYARLHQITPDPASQGIEKDPKQPSSTRKRPPGPSR